MIGCRTDYLLAVARYTAILNSHQLWTTSLESRQGSESVVVRCFIPMQTAYYPTGEVVADYYSIPSH